MVSHSLPSPPAEDPKSGKKSKSTKPAHRASKRSSNSAAHQHHHDQVTHGAGMDGRHKRVWKACERCRMKKTKCDGEFPCKRCKDDGLVCTAGVRKKMEYKQLPRGYAEVLENTQLTLIATVHKLYSMVRNSQTWDLGEPDLNDRGQPVIHNIAQKLGCIRPNSDIDLPVHSVFPEDEAGMTELARQLEDQQAHDHDGTSQPKDNESSSYPRTERASSSELDHSDVDVDFDYRKMAFGNNNAMTLSPSSFASSADLDFGASTDMDQNAMFSTQSSSSLPNLNNWSVPKMQQQPQQQSQLSMQFLPQSSALQGLDLMGSGMMDSDFNTIKPDILSMSGQDAMMGLGDPMMYGGFDNEMRL